MKVTEIQVLERAIKDAMKGGLSKLDILALLPPGHTDQHIMVMLYDHRFNKALWGENEVCTGTYHLINGYSKGTTHSWKHHISLMSLSGDPLAYIAKTKYGIKVDDTEN